MTDPAEAAELAQQTLDDEFAALGTDHVDILLLKDSATCEVMQAQWKVLESALAAGLCHVFIGHRRPAHALIDILAHALIGDERFDALRRTKRSTRRALIGGPGKFATREGDTFHKLKRSSLLSRGDPREVDAHRQHAKVAQRRARDDWQRVDDGTAYGE